MTSTPLTVGEVKATNCFASCDMSCFMDKDAEISPTQKKIAQCTLGVFLAILSLQALPSLFYSRKEFVTGLVFGFGIGLVACMTMNISLKIRQGPFYGSSRVIKTVTECYAAKNVFVKTICTVALAGFIIMKAVPPYYDDKINANINIIGALFPGFMLGAITSELAAYQITRLFQYMGCCLQNPEESVPLFTQPPYQAGTELRRAPAHTKPVHEIV